MNIEELNKQLKEVNQSDFVAIIRKLIAEENEAFVSYTEKSKVLEEQGYSDLAKVLLDIANEELVHAGELQELLNREGLSGEEYLEKGKEEVEEFLDSI